MHNEFKGTPGPWHVSFHGSENCWVVDSEQDSAVAKVPKYKNCGDAQKANFNLISAAPELLAALQLCEEFMSGLESTGFDGLARIEAARAAIAKALGEQS